MSQITVISRPERRRVWTDQQKRELVAAVSAPGANVAEIARRADLRPNQIYRWRRQMGQAAQDFAEVQVQADPVPMIGSAITVEFERAIVRIQADAYAVPTGTEIPQKWVLPHFRCKDEERTMNLVDSQRLDRKGASSNRVQAYLAARSTPADRGAGHPRGQAHCDQLPVAIVGGALPKLPTRVVTVAQQISAAYRRSPLARPPRNASHSCSPAAVPEPEVRAAHLRRTRGGPRQQSCSSH